MLAYMVAALGVLIVMLGAAVVAFPAVMREVGAMMRAPKALYGAIAGRILGGAFLLFASSACSWPEVIGAMGVLALAAGFAGLFLGIRRLQSLVDWVVRRPANAMRFGGVAAVATGAFVVYSAIL